MDEVLSVAGHYDMKNTEGDIEWSVENVSGKTFEIKAFNNKTYKIATQSYELAYEPAFGLGVYDKVQIEKLLDEVIQEVNSQ